MTTHVAQHAAQVTHSRLLVAWQNPESRLISPIGFLDHDSDGYRFRYVERALRVDGFRPLLGFPNFYADYRSDDLFPIFAQRVMSARRPEYGEFLAELDLSTDSSPSPMEILSRSGGRRVGDTIQLLPVPPVYGDGTTSCEFLISGLRHRLQQDPRVSETIAAMRPGDRLTLEDEPTNPVNHRALVALCEDGVIVGWVPDLLLDYVHELRTFGRYEITVAHVNGPETPPHLRILARISGEVGPAYSPFDGDGWRVGPELDPVADGVLVGNASA